MWVCPRTHAPHPPLLPLALLFAACDAGPQEPAGPVVTGFNPTTEEPPVIDEGLACGEPTHTSGAVTAVPNHYRGYSLYETGPDDRRMRLINIPGRVRIEIVRAAWQGRDIPGWGDVVRVIEKDSTDGESFDWDLRDAGGALVPSGFYRATFTFPYGAPQRAQMPTDTGFDDLYVGQREDVETWDDPTGCL